MSSNDMEPAVLVETKYKCVKCGRVYESEKEAFECFKTHARAVDLLPDRKESDCWFFGDSRSITLPASVIVKFEHENNDVFARYSFVKCVNAKEDIRHG